MNYDRIDVLEHGTVWQGGAVDASINQPPFSGPLLIVCMDKGEEDGQFIDHITTEAVLSVWIEDSPSACLKDSVLIDLADTIISFLKDNGNTYLHCAAGISRASYIDIAVHCRALGISALDALARIKVERPIANPNSGFMAQLERLWPA